MKRIIGNIIFVIYAAIAVFVTVCLLSYNEYKITEFGNESLLIIDNNSLEPDFYSGDLVIVNRNDKIEIGDNIFFYNTAEDTVEVTLGKVTDAELVTSKQITYTINDQLSLSSDYVIGSAKSASRIAGVGTVLTVLESKWGFLFIIVFPSLIAFIYEIYIVIMEIKDSNEETKKKKSKSKAKNENKDKEKKSKSTSDEEEE